MTLTAPLELRGPGESPPVWSYNLDARKKVMVVWSARELDDAWKELLDRAVQKLVGEFRGTEFGSAYDKAATR